MPSTTTTRRASMGHGWGVHLSRVALESVSKVYPDGTAAVSNLDLEVRDGEFLVLVGPSGCGKTTALRMVAGLEDITHGVVRIGDRAVNDVPSRNRDVAMVFQSYALYPHLTVAENIGFGLKLRKTPKAEIRARVLEAAHILGLEEQLDRKPRNLSGGQRQRVAMGRAIVRKPQVFLMDEPLSNLDAKLRVQMRAEIARIQRDLGVTTIYVTHDQVEAMTLGHRVAVMRKGVLQQVDAPQVLYDRPVNLFVAGFIGSPAMNLLEGRFERDGTGLTLHLGSQLVAVGPELLARRPALVSHLDRDVVVGIRPEDMEDAALSSAPPEHRIKAAVDLVEAMGSDLLVHLATDAPNVVTDDVKELAEDVGDDAALTRSVIVARFSPRSSANDGETVDLAIDTDRLHVFDPDSGSAIWE
jgi:multiple sugar transport system ATP-binding protein